MIADARFMGPNINLNKMYGFYVKEVMGMSIGLTNIHLRREPGTCDKIEHVNMYNKKISDEDKIDGLLYKACNFDDAYAENIQFRDCEFNSCSFDGTRFINCKFDNCKFINCKIVSASFSHDCKVMYCMADRCTIKPFIRELTVIDCAFTRSIIEILPEHLITEGNSIIDCKLPGIRLDESSTESVTEGTNIIRHSHVGPGCKQYIRRAKF